MMMKVQHRPGSVVLLWSRRGHIIARFLDKITRVTFHTSADDSRHGSLRVIN